MISHNSHQDCPICGGETLPKFSVPCDYRKPNNSKHYKINWCAKCDYGMISYRPSKNEVKKFYDLNEYYTHNINESQNDEYSISFLDRLRIHLSYRFDKGEDFNPREVKPFLPSVKPKICEIGCGNGNNLAKFRDLGYEIFGIEPDSKARAVARQVTPNIFEGTAEDFPSIIKEQQYDIVLMSHVLEHCLDINAAVSNVRHILKNRGIFIVEIPNCNSLGFKTYQGEWPWSDIPRHLNFFTLSSSGKILNKHGFQIKTVKYSGFGRQFSNKWLRNEREIWTVFSQYSKMPKKCPDFRYRAWKMLLKSALASNESKYDSIRLIGVK